VRHRLFTRADWGSQKNRPYHRLYLSIPSVSMNATSSRTSSSNSLTQHDEEKKDDSTTPEAIAKRLRDKIRLQAESLLSRCETADRSRQSSRNASCQASRDSSPRGGNNSRHNEAVESSSTFQTPLPDGLNSDPDSSVATPRTLTADLWPDTNGNNSTRENTPPTRSVSNNSVSNNPDSLTKRLQQLALQRQSIDSNRDRLRVIQSDASSHLSSKCTSFADLPHLPPHLLQALYQMGFDRPSAIQEEALPRILQGRHVIGQAQSGSGKVRNTNHIQRHACTLLAKIASGKVLEILPTHSMTCSLGSWSRDRRRPLRLACCIAWTLP
jgi:hypothetical protein